MLRNPDGSGSLSSCVFAGAWLMCFAIVARVVASGDFTQASGAAALIGAILTPAGLVYGWRRHAQGSNKNDPTMRGG